MADWTDVEIGQKLFKNIDEGSLTATYAALENCFVTEAKGLSRFPGLVEFCDLGGNSDIYINKYGNDMIAVGLDGRTHRIDSNANSRLIEGPPVLGGDPVSFSRTKTSLIMAAGAQIIAFDGEKNNVLSKDAPLSSFVGYVDGYLLAVEKESGRFQYCQPDDLSSWPALNTIAVEGSPDNINAMLVTPFNEILFCGEESIEQFERNSGGESPFFRRWSTGDGIIEPWTLCHADNAAWGLNSKMEFSRISGQTTQSVSDDIQKEIEHRYSINEFGSLKRAWAKPVNIKGQKFIILQAPESTNGYGTKGITFVFDIKKGQYFELFGWDERTGLPTLWPGRSVFQIWGKTFVGGQGKIYELSPNAYSNDNKTQRVYARTAHFDTAGCMRIDRVRMTLKRGVGTYDTEPSIMFRTNPDNKGFGAKQIRTIGKTGAPDFTIEFGAQGIGTTWQFEMAMTDNAPFELRRLQIDATRIDR